MENRQEEVRMLSYLTPDEIISRSGNHLIVCEDLDALHQKFAEDIAEEIENNNNNQQPSRFILPVGPTGQYPYLCKLIKMRNISLSSCWFFFMDEYCDENGQALSTDHPLSFKRIAKEKFFDLLDDLHGLDMTRVYTPDNTNIHKLAGIIDSIGGLDACFGGIGIHGHVAFNEPAPNIKNSPPRKVSLNNFTITINAIRAQVGGNLENFPREAFTLGMQQILNAKKIRLYCRNGTPYDWANTILRIALLGKPGDDYPVTYIRNKDYIITTDKDTLQTAKNNL